MVYQIQSTNTRFRELSSQELLIVSGGSDEIPETVGEPIVVETNKITNDSGSSSGSGGFGGFGWFGGFGISPAPHGPPAQDPFSGLQKASPEDEGSQYRVPGDGPGTGAMPVDVSKPINSQASSPPP